MKKRALITIILLTMVMISIALCSCGGADDIQFSTQADAESATEYVATESETQKVTQEQTQVPTEESTQEMTETEAPVESPTEVATEIETEKSAEESTEVSTEASTQSPELTIEQKVEAKLAKMSLEQKIYQMIIIQPEQLTGEKRVISAGEETRLALNKYPVGGIIYFEGNIVSPSQTKDMIFKTKQYGWDSNGLPLFMCIDEEGGRVARIGNNAAFGVTTFSNMAHIGSAANAGVAGSTIGSYLKEYGFNVDFAPNADVLTNPLNSVIGERSFGSDPVVVRDRALAFAKGLNSKGVLATYKHFPGHGCTEGDTHEGFAYTGKTLDELKKSELVPFISAATNDIDFVMTAHISTPGVLGDNTPASLSYKMVTEVLKNQLGYKGLIVTDSLRMGAVANSYTDEQIAVMAVKAGNDLLLMPKDFKVAVAAIKKAVESGEITESRINDSVRKILKVKYDM